MKLNLFLINILIITSISTKSQTKVDTIFYNAKWETTNKNNFEYYRTIERNDNKPFLVNDYWKSGQLQMTGTFSSMKPEVKNGRFIWYYQNGNKKYEIFFSNNNVSGLISKYLENGKLDIEYLTEIDSLDNSTEFYKCIDLFRDFVNKSLEYPNKSRKRGIQGVVKTKFYITPSNEILKLEITQNINEDLDTEALRVIKSFNGWSTPKYKDKSVYLELNFPIIFVLR